MRFCIGPGMGFEMGVPGSTVAAALGPAALIGGVAAFFGAALALADAKRASTFARVVSMGLPFFAVVFAFGAIAQPQSPQCQHVLNQHSNIQAQKCWCYDAMIAT